MKKKTVHEIIQASLDRNKAKTATPTRKVCDRLTGTGERMPAPAGTVIEYGEVWTSGSAPGEAYHELR